MHTDIICYKGVIPTNADNDLAFQNYSNVMFESHKSGLYSIDDFVELMERFREINDDFPEPIDEERDVYTESDIENFAVSLKEIPFEIRQDDSDSAQKLEECKVDLDKRAKSFVKYITERHQNVDDRGLNELESMLSSEGINIDELDDYVNYVQIHKDNIPNLRTSPFWGHFKEEMLIPHYYFEPRENVYNDPPLIQSAVPNMKHLFTVKFQGIPKKKFLADPSIFEFVIDHILHGKFNIPVEPNQHVYLRVPFNIRFYQLTHNVKTNEQYPLYQSSEYTGDSILNSQYLIPVLEIYADHQQIISSAVPRIHKTRLLGFRPSDNPIVQNSNYYGNPKYLQLIMLGNNTQNSQNKFVEILDSLSKDGYTYGGNPILEFVWHHQLPTPPTNHEFHDNKRLFYEYIYSLPNKDIDQSFDSNFPGFTKYDLGKKMLTSTAFGSAAGYGIKMLDSTIICKNKGKKACKKDKYCKYIYNKNFDRGGECIVNPSGENMFSPQIQTDAARGRFGALNDSGIDDMPSYVEESVSPLTPVPFSLPGSSSGTPSPQNHLGGSRRKFRRKSIKKRSMRKDGIKKKRSTIKSKTSRVKRKNKRSGKPKKC